VNGKTWHAWIRRIFSGDDLLSDLALSRLFIDFCGTSCWQATMAQEDEVLRKQQALMEK